MQSSWYPRPFYKVNLAVTLIALSICGCYIWLTSYGWLLFWTIAFFSALILIGSSFIICSGLYVTTICSSSNKNNKIALTFDDGPCEQTTEILNILDKYNAKASFFIIGRQAELHRDITSIIAQKQHAVGNHSFEHKSWFPIMGTEKIIKELSDTQKTLKEITGAEPIYFRPPFGITNPLVAKALKRFNFKVIGWSVRSLDTVTEDPEKVLERIKSKVKRGSIVLLHDTTKNAPMVLEQLLIYCKHKNLTPVSLDELLSSR
jgi:peptidoglycan/xylan/chitin deacetylase (PgdA/CDA1 family)